MRDTDFSDLPDVRLPFAVPARPSRNGLWTHVHPFVEGPGLLRIVTEDDGRWGYAPRSDAFCYADGDPCSLVSRDQCLSSSAPVGAMIGKIGGSSAGIDDGCVFVVGHTCVIRVPDDGGPLYLTINDTRDGMENNGNDIKVVTLQWMAAPAKPKPKPAEAKPA